MSPPTGTDVESNPTLATDLTSKPRPKPAKQAIAPSTLDAVDEFPHQHPKRGRSRSDTNGTVPASIIQPPAKKTKVSNTTSPADDIGNSVESHAASISSSFAYQLGCQSRCPG